MTLSSEVSLEVGELKKALRVVSIELDQNTWLYQAPSPVDIAATVHHLVIEASATTKIYRRERNHQSPSLV